MPVPRSSAGGARHGPSVSAPVSAVNLGGSTVAPPQSGPLVSSPNGSEIGTGIGVTGLTSVGSLSTSRVGNAPTYTSPPATSSVGLSVKPATAPSTCSTCDQANAVLTEYWWVLLIAVVVILLLLFASG